MNYEQARDKIEDGDLIATRRAHSLFGRLTKFFTHSVYTHNGIAVWIDGGLWMAEINGGKNHLVPLSQLNGEDFDVFYPPEGIDRTAIRRQIFEDMRIKVPYGYLATIATGLIEFFRLNVFVHWRSILHCAGYSQRTYERAGAPEATYIVSPGRLAASLTFKLAVKA